jgi:hypothetical protein
MPYFVSSIIAVVAAMVIMFTRYEADDSTITAELDRVKSMFMMVDGFVNTYVESGGDLTDVNFQKLSCNGILLGNIKDTLATTNCETTNTSDGSTDNVKGFKYASTLTFPSSSVKWQLLPVINITPSDDTDFGSSAGSAYKLLVDMTANASLKSKGAFSESFSSREFCEKMLFGTSLRTGKSYDSTAGKETFSLDGTDRDGFFVCIVFK